MPDLSACYFCGTALDEPLSEYPVVPMTLSPAPEDQKTVVLCSVCRRKLGKVLDAVLDSIEDRPIEATVQQDLAGASEEGSANGDGVDADEAGGDDAGDDEARDDDAGEVAAEVDGKPAETEWATAGQSGDDHGDSGEFEVDSGEFEVDAAEEDEATEDAPEDQTGGATDTVPADDAETREDPPKATDGNGEDDDGPHLSALEYTKVMRLLENRDLPVDREEFKIVATNAYEITPEEFDTVIDAAIDRGLVVEEDGQFVDVE